MLIKLDLLKPAGVVELPLFFDPATLVLGPLLARALLLAALNLQPPFLL
jgi:hypothetical protein